jgi:hypothetical protein
MKIEPAGDYAELIPDTNDEGVNPMRLCPKCGQCKPFSHFKERLTKLQARKQGYAGTHAVYVERSMCAPCQPKRRSFNYKNLKDISNAVYYGVISEYEADELRAKRAKARSRTSTDNMREHHHAKRKEAWQPLRKAVRRDYQWASNLLILLKKTDRQDTELFEFVSWYRDVPLGRISYKVWEIMRAHANFDIPPPPERLSDLVKDTPELLGNLLDKWFKQIPAAQTARLKPPALIREALWKTYVLPKE